MFHVHAWGMPYNATVMGVKQVYPGKYDPAFLLQLIKNEKVTFSHCVPTILHMLISHPAAKEIDLSGWKLVIGGARLPRGLAKAAMGSRNRNLFWVRYVRDLPVPLHGRPKALYVGMG